MADNVTVTAGTGTTIGADEISSVKYQRVKIITGVNGTNDGDVSSANPMPVTAAALPLPTGAATSAKQLANNHDVVVTATALPTGAATAAKQLPDGHNVAVTGSVAVTNAGITSIDGKITACNTGAVVVSSGALNADLRIAGAAVTTSNPVPIMPPASGSLAVNDAGGALTVDGTVAVSGSVAVTNAGITSIDGKITACNTGAVVLAAGTANIGDVDVLSLPAIPAGTNNIGDVDVATIAAGDNNIGNVDIVTLPNVKDQIDEATFVVKTIDFTASQTAQTIWTPASGKKFVICDLVCSASAAGAITIFDATDNTTLRVAKFNLAANGGAVVAYKKPYKSATADNVLKYTTGAGIAGSITISGYEV